MSSGKGVIPYESIKQWENFKKIPKTDFFEKTNFYSSLKNSTISDQEYEDVKKLFCLMKMQDLSDLNALYNFQNTIILGEIFENRAKNMLQKFKFNPRKSSSASTLSGAIHRDLSKAITCFLTKEEIVELLEKNINRRNKCCQHKNSF